MRNSIDSNAFSGKMLHFSKKIYGIFFEGHNQTFLKKKKKVSSTKIEWVIMKIRSVPNFLCEKIDENNPLTTPLIKIDLHPCAILFIYVLLICQRSLTNLKCLIFEKLELKVKNYFSQFHIFHPFFENISENT